MGAEAPASRAESGVVYVAGLVQGLALVTFPAAGTTSSWQSPSC